MAGRDIAKFVLVYIYKGFKGYVSRSQKPPLYKAITILTDSWQSVLLHGREFKFHLYGKRKIQVGNFSK